MQINSCTIYIIHSWPKPFPRERFGVASELYDYDIYKYSWVFSALCTFVPLLSYAFVFVFFRQGIMLRWVKLWRWPENFVKWGRKELWCSTRRAFWPFLILMWFLWSDINMQSWHWSPQKCSFCFLLQLAWHCPGPIPTFRKHCRLPFAAILRLWRVQKLLLFPSSHVSETDSRACGQGFVGEAAARGLWGQTQDGLCWSSCDAFRVGFHQQWLMGQNLGAEPMVEDNQFGCQARSADQATWKGWFDCSE